jgi:hypothetical protein
MKYNIYKVKLCLYVFKAGSNNTIQPHRPPVEICRSPCVEYTSCRNCTETECIWCQNEERCIDKNAYPASFPYGQCREWTTSHDKCRSTKTGTEWCSSHNSCANCRADPACGWCDDGSDTGRGKCLPGGARQPSHKSPERCPLDRWFFTECPRNLPYNLHFSSNRSTLKFAFHCSLY